MRYSWWSTHTELRNQYAQQLKGPNHFHLGRQESELRVATASIFRIPEDSFAINLKRKKKKNLLVCVIEKVAYNVYSWLLIFYFQTYADTTYLIYVRTAFS